MLCFVVAFPIARAEESQRKNLKPDVLGEETPADKDSSDKDIPIWSDFISPVTTEAKYLFYYGAALTIVLAALEDQVSDPAQQDVVEDRPLGSFSRFGELAGQVYPNAFYTLGMLVHGMITGRERSYARSKLMFKTTFYSSALTTMLKYSVREPRPDSSNRDAFPSGHTTTAFAFASVVALEHPWPYGLAAYSMAGLVGFSRMNDNKHLLHHVVGGAVIGASYGLALYYKQGGSSKRVESEPETQSQFQILPTEGFDGAMALYSTDFSF